MKGLIISISGLVQGIGFRPFVYRIAVQRGLKGRVRNMGDAGVEIEVHGDEEAIRTFLTDLVEMKPPIAIYTDLKEKWLDYDDAFPGFTIVESHLGGRDVRQSIIPPDISVCGDCLRDISDPEDRHHRYAFTCCAVCGPRFTTMTDIPYDRERTTMSGFPLCESCNREFFMPVDRRFNAQTICCPQCGPRMTLYDREGGLIEGESPLGTAAQLLSEGSILAVKGIGGIHLAVKTTEDEPILRLRDRRRKANKPFAIMSTGLDEVERYAHVSDLERETLESYARPIVVLGKREPFPLSAHISPGLHTVGVMLPYSGIHQLLLDNLAEPALVMTSANFPGEPMIVSNQAAFKGLKEVADYFLLHNREIWARCDDSVVRTVDDSPAFLRRSRGYVPMPIYLPFSSELKVAAVGPELTSTASILKEDKCYPSQHLGDLDSPESMAFLREALGHLMKILGVEKPDVVACDLHPGFLSSIVASELQEQGASLVEVQHHHAHLASLMAENGIQPGREVVGITCDGYGYGSDDGAWGGEILVGGYEGFHRAGSLEPQPMPGGDLCAYRYGRMLQGVLYSEMPKERLRDFLLAECMEGYVRGEKEVDMVFNQLEKGIYAPDTTSAGRLIDAVSCLLDISHQRTYEGEGAMKLESAASGASNQIHLPVEIEKQGSRMTLKTSHIVGQLMELRQYHGKAELARAFQAALAEGLAEMALRVAEKQGLEEIGFTGGVAYNDMITRIIHRRVSERGRRFLRHRLVPCGDGGISLGQAAVASFHVQ